MPDHWDHESNRRPGQFIGHVPPGDHPVAATHVAEKSVALIRDTLLEIVDMCEVHTEMAPTSTDYVVMLTAILAEDTLAWIRQWPAQGTGPLG